MAWTVLLLVSFRSIFPHENMQWNWPFYCNMLIGRILQNDTKIRQMKNLRCDQKADCDDQSDEASCQIVHLNPEQYLKDKPPPPLEVGSLVKILVNVDIERILTISEVSAWQLEISIAAMMGTFQGGRHFWDTTKHRAGVEGPTVEGNQHNFNFYHLWNHHYSQQLTFRQFSALQPPSTFPREYVDGGGKEPNMDSLNHICKHSPKGIWMPSHQRQ